jgi:hypothetical protein
MTTGSWTLFLETKLCTLSSVDHTLKEIAIKNARHLLLRNPSDEIVCDLTQRKNRPASISLPDVWTLRLIIDEHTQLIPPRLSAALLEQFRRSLSNPAADNDGTGHCDTFVKRMVEAQQLPLLIRDTKSEHMESWYPVVLYSDPTKRSAAQVAFNVEEEPDFLHSALWTGIDRYYFNKMGVQPVYVILTMGQMLQLYTTVKEIRYSRPFHIGCCNSGCKISTPYQRIKPLTICKCRQAQYCSKKCHNKMRSTHDMMCKLVKALMTQAHSPAPYWVQSVEQVQATAQRFVQHSKESADAKDVKKNFFDAYLKSVSHDTYKLALECAEIATAKLIVLWSPFTMDFDLKANPFWAIHSLSEDQSSDVVEFNNLDPSLMEGGVSPLYLAIPTPVVDSITIRPVRFRYKVMTGVGILDTHDTKALAKATEVYNSNLMNPWEIISDWIDDGVGLGRNLIEMVHKHPKWIERRTRLLDLCLQHFKTICSVGELVVIMISFLFARIE